MNFRPLTHLAFAILACVATVCLFAAVILAYDSFAYSLR